MENIPESVLIITFDMIPYSPSWGACQRIYFLAEYLENKGVDVTVVHATGNNFGDFEMPVHFHRIPVGGNSSTNGISQSESGSKSRLLQSAMRSIKFLLKKSHISFFENLIFNDPTPWKGIIGYLFARNARSAILKAIKERSISIVIISGPPFSLFSLAPIIKRKFPDVKIIFDYRDPWNADSSPRISTLLEKKYLKYPDKVVFLNDRMLSDCLQRYGLPESKCDTVLNGYSKKDWDVVEKQFLESPQQPIPKNSRMVISFIGSANFSKGGIADFSTFFDAFQIFQKNRTILLRFIGISPSEETEKIKQRFNNNIEIIPAVSLQNSYKYMLSSDVLLLLHTQKTMAKYVMTGKMFDYIRSGKVICGMGSEKETYFLDFIAKYKLGLGCINQPTDIQKTLEILYYHWENGTLDQVRQNVGLNIEDYSRDEQNFKYLKILENL
jgi:glycosyltransferase involved in cell wall biosynthesis